MGKIYRFHASSSLSFRVVNRGREVTVTFSPCYRSCATFFTLDESLAAKIRAHKWFRTGRITEIPDTEEETITPSTSPTTAASQSPKRPAYSILGRRMVVSNSPAAEPFEASQSDASSVESVAISDPDNQASVESPSVDQEVTETTIEAESSLSIQEVSSFLEAKDWVVAHFQVDRASLRSKADLTDFCVQHDIVFENYPLES